MIEVELAAGERSVAARDSTCAASARRERRWTASRSPSAAGSSSCSSCSAVVGTATLDELHALLFGDRPISPTTLRAEISHTRVPCAGGSRRGRTGSPSRPGSTPSTCSTASTSGDLAGALERYDGPLLPSSDAPLIVERRYHLDVALRTALLRSGTTAQLLRFAAVHPADVEVFERPSPSPDPTTRSSRRPIAALAVATADLAT